MKIWVSICPIQFNISKTLTLKQETEYCKTELKRNRNSIFLKSGKNFDSGHGYSTLNANFNVPVLWSIVIRIEKEAIILFMIATIKSVIICTVIKRSTRV